MEGEIGTTQKFGVALPMTPQTIIPALLTGDAQESSLLSKKYVGNYLQRKRDMFSQIIIPYTTNAQLHRCPFQVREDTCGKQTVLVGIELAKYHHNNCTPNSDVMDFVRT